MTKLVGKLLDEEPWMNMNICVCVCVYISSPLLEIWFRVFVRMIKSWWCHPVYGEMCVIVFQMCDKVRQAFLYRELSVWMRHSRFKPCTQFYIPREENEDKCSWKTLLRGTKYTFIVEFYAYQKVSVWLWFVIVGSPSKPFLGCRNKP